MKKVDAHKHYWLGENKQHHPEHETIIRMIDPRVFIKYEVRLALFADYDEFVNHIADIQWIDEKPNKRIQEQILTEAWNFLCIEDEFLENDLREMEEEDEF